MFFQGCKSYLLGCRVPGPLPDQNCKTASKLRGKQGVLKSAPAFVGSTISMCQHIPTKMHTWTHKYVKSWPFGLFAVVVDHCFTYFLGRKYAPTSPQWRSLAPGAQRALHSHGPIADHAALALLCSNTYIYIYPYTCVYTYIYIYVCTCQNNYQSQFQITRAKALLDEVKQDVNCILVRY